MEIIQFKFPYSTLTFWIANSTIKSVNAIYLLTATNVDYFSFAHRTYQDIEIVLV